MPEVSPYSTLRNKRNSAAKHLGFVSQLYENMLKPTGLLALIVAVYALVWKQIPSGIDAKLLFDDSRGRLYGLMLLFTFIMGLRLIQSIWLAQLDYQALQAGPFDVVIFLVVIAFTTGAVFKFFSFGETKWISLVYLVFSIVGLLNFCSLYAFRLPKRSNEVDYVIERRIQALNVLTFVHVALAMICVFIVTAWYPRSLTLANCAVLSTLPTLILNMVHSWQLTSIPKFLLSNTFDAQDNVIRRFRTLHPGASRSLTDETLRSSLLGAEYKTFQPVTLVRATHDQIPQIVELLNDEVGYIYKHIFASNDVDALKKVLTRMVQMFGGFASLGYTRFYAIKGGRATIGFVLLDSRMKCAVYNWLESLALLPLIGASFGWLSLAKIYRNSKPIIASQPQPDEHEICLTYLLIRAPYRRQGYGSSVVRLLINALKDNANNVCIDRILTLVRKHNAPSLALFEKQGFTEMTAEDNSNSHVDPFRDVDGIGESVYLEYDIASRFD